MEVEIGLLWLDAKNCQEMPGANGIWTHQDLIPTIPWRLQRERGPADTLIFGLLDSRNVKG